jgi:hypothetical protein
LINKPYKEPYKNKSLFIFRVAIRGMRGKVGASPHPVSIPGGHSTNTGTDSIEKAGIVSEKDD